jgi:hypothetical protein
MNVTKFLKHIRARDDYETIKNVIEEYTVSIKKDVTICYDATVYRIFCLDPNISDSYVGYTIKSIDFRMYHHKKTCENSGYKYHHKKLYRFIRENGGFENFSFEILEKCHVTISEARSREQNFINIYRPTLNKIESCVIYQ